MKKTAAAVLAAAVLTAALTASAGTPSDPLISRSYADGVTFSAVTEAAAEKFGDTVASAYEARLAAAGLDSGDTALALGWHRLALDPGGAVEVFTGCEFALGSGSAEVTPAGAVLDLGSGRELQGAETLARGVKYFAAEGAGATVEAQGDTIIYVCGRYRPGEGAHERHIYSDVSDTSAWYYGDVYWASALKLFHAWEEEQFRPEENGSRAEIVYALWVGAGSPASGQDESFEDVEPGAWYAPAIAWARENGIVNGYGDGRFGVGDSIIREQIAAVFMRYAAYLGRDTAARADISGFDDQGEISEWAREYVSWANAEGLINGIGGNKLGALGTTTRSQVAALLRRLGLR